MQNNKVLKKLLAVSAVAAMFSAFGVHAQTSSTGSQGSQGSTQGGSSASGTSDSSSTAGKTASDGTASSASNQGMDGSTQGRDQSSGSSSGSSSGTSGMSGSTGTSAGGTAGQDGAGTSSSASGQGSSGSSSTGQGSAGGSSTATGGAAGQGGMAAGGAAAGGSLSKSDQKILMDMARANMAEIEAGKVAQSKSQNDQVKSFAQQMIDDHTKALGDVQQVAQAKGVTLPTEPDASHKALVSKLEKLSGDSFDKTYMSNAGLADHKKVLSMLRKDEKRAKDPDVKALAEKMTPVVEQHLKAAQQLPAVKSGTTSGK
jgi:predicted outer membrane protein